MQKHLFFDFYQNTVIILFLLFRSIIAGFFGVLLRFHYLICFFILFSLFFVVFLNYFDVWADEVLYLQQKKPNLHYCAYSSAGGLIHSHGE
ncbi:hypothetical protein EC2016001_0719 [Escherichia coli 201600.1]|nr:hypothetical protein EC2016001_0719 [Escherichia coli 201600.1]